IVGQIEKILGLSIKAEEPIPQVQEVAREISQTSASTLVVALVSVAVLLVLRTFLPKVPAALVVVVGGIAMSAALSLDQHGVATVGHIPAGLPSLSIPDVTAGDAVKLIPAALA